MEGFIFVGQVPGLVIGVRQVTEVDGLTLAADYAKGLEALIDSMTQTSEQTRFGLRAQLGSELVLRNNIGLTLEFKLDHVFNVLQYSASDGSSEAATEEKSVASISFLAGLVFPL